MGLSESNANVAGITVAETGPITSGNWVWPCTNGATQNIVQPTMNSDGSVDISFNDPAGSNNFVITVSYMDGTNQQVNISSPVVFPVIVQQSTPYGGLGNASGDATTSFTKPVEGGVAALGHLIICGTKNAAGGGAGGLMTVTDDHNDTYTACSNLATGVSGGGGYIYETLATPGVVTVTTGGGSSTTFTDISCIEVLNTAPLFDNCAGSTYTSASGIAFPSITGTATSAQPDLLVAFGQMDGTSAIGASTLTDNGVAAPNPLDYLTGSTTADGGTAWTTTTAVVYDGGPFVLSKSLTPATYQSGYIALLPVWPTPDTLVAGLRSKAIVAGKPLSSYRGFDHNPPLLPLDYYNHSHPVRPFFGLRHRFRMGGPH